MPGENLNNLKGILKDKYATKKVTEQTSIPKKVGFQKLSIKGKK